jgi:hypothetical protein
MSGCVVRHSEPIARRDPDVWDVSFWVEGRNAYGGKLTGRAVMVPIEKTRIEDARRAAAVVEDWANRKIRYMSFRNAERQLQEIVVDLASTEI